MLTEHHDFAGEHPEYKDQISNLKSSDAHFKKLFNEYNEINKEILRIEKEVEVASDERLENLKSNALILMMK